MIIRRRRSGRPATRTAVLGLAVVLILVTGCTGGNTTEPGKDDPLQTKATAEVTALAEARARAVATSAGVPLENWRTSTAPCVGRGGEIADDGRWTLNGFAGLLVSAADQLATLHRIRDMWRQQGYEITEDRVFADGTRGAVSVRDPETSISISLTTTPSRERIALILASGCYLPVSGEDPANA